MFVNEEIELNRPASDILLSDEVTKNKEENDPERSNDEEVNGHERPNNEEENGHERPNDEEENGHERPNDEEENGHERPMFDDENAVDELAAKLELEEVLKKCIDETVLYDDIIK
eukprot:397334_1